MAENSSVCAPMGTLLPNQKDPPCEGEYNNPCKIYRSSTEYMRQLLAHVRSTLHVQIYGLQHRIFSFVFGVCMGLP